MGRLVDPLRERMRVIAVDNRGAGRSDKPDQPYSIAMFATDALAVLDAVGVGRAVVFGLSMGGRVALELALRHADRVSGLVLVSTGARVQRTRARWLMTSVLPRLPIARSAYPQPYHAFRRQLAATGAYDASSRLGEIAVPTLILHGRRDHTAPPVLAEELHRGIAGSGLRWLDGGHLSPLLRQRDRTVAAVTEFVAHG
jgi:pimeloyl-ACP methyl ester carboxylesterase